MFHRRRSFARVATGAILSQHSSVPSYTPVATPVVRAGTLPQSQVRPNTDKLPELVAPVTVITPIGEFELGTGSLLLGRLPECDVLLEDSLVSRMHARISVQDTHVVIEDLHSTNGVYVNEQRVAHGAVLRREDRILIGTTEISLSESRDSGGQHLHVVEAGSGSAPKGGARPEPAARTGAPAKGEMPSTARADALKAIGKVAERLAADGNPEQAEHILSGHLRGIVSGVNAGLELPGDVAASASRYALDVARWTKQPFWADYVVELHLSARLAMSAATLSSFEHVIAALDCDRIMLGYYIDDLQRLGKKLSADEQRRVERLRVLLRNQRG